MMPARMSALERLLAHFGEGDDELLKKLSPKLAAVEVTKAEPVAVAEGDSELSPEVIAKVLEALKGAHSEPDGDEAPMKMAKGGKVMGDKLCAGCGHMNSDCTCYKMAEGGLIDSDSLQDEVMRRREEERKAEEEKNAADDAAELGGAKLRGKPAYSVRKSRYYKG